MNFPDFQVLQAIARLESEPDWQAFVGWLEASADEAVGRVLVCEQAVLPEARAEAATLRRIVDSVHTAAETIRRAAEISTPGTPQYSGSRFDEA